MSILREIKYKLKRLIRFGRTPTVEDLRRGGVTIGNNVSINTKGIDLGHGFLITIGDNVIIAADAMILAHDASTKNIVGYSKVGKVEIGNNVFIGARSIILPNVKIGDNVIIGAGSVVSKNIPSDSVAVGAPCHIISSYKQYEDKIQEEFNTLKKYDSYWPEKSKEEKEKMKKEIEVGVEAFDP